MYTIEDLDSAEKELNRWNEAFANDRSNNPNKYEAQIRDAGIEVRKIRDYLKAQGEIEKTEAEKLCEELDALFPNAKSKAIVSHNDKRYQISYYPLVRSRSRKTVKEWGRRWTEV